VSRPTSMHNPGDSNSTRWNAGFAHLKQFAEREGHSSVSESYRSDDGYRLGQWVAVQRAKREKLEPERRQRLETIPGWSWDPFADRWNEGISCLEQFVEREGHSRVSQSYRNDDGYRLGQWVSVQRANREKINPHRRHRLEMLPGWSWHRGSDQWNEGFSHLKQFSDRVGHCRVPHRYQCGDGYRLGQWVVIQRRNKDRMGPDRRHRLGALPGWAWRLKR
jgi:hypothetical protein